MWEELPSSRECLAAFRAALLSEVLHQASAIYLQAATLTGIQTTTNRATTGMGLVLSGPTLAFSQGKHLPKSGDFLVRVQWFASLNRWTDGQSTPVFLIPHLGDVLFSQDGDGDSSCNHAMARCAPGHFSFHPDDLDGREMVTTVRTATDGELKLSSRRQSTWKCRLFSS